MLVLVYLIFISIHLRCRARGHNRPDAEEEDVMSTEPESGLAEASDRVGGRRCGLG